jgi:hypothetical protein
MERYRQTYKVTWLFFSAYAIISFALRARNYFSFYLGLGRNVGIPEGFLMPVLATLRTTAINRSSLIVLIPNL